MMMKRRRKSNQAGGVIINKPEDQKSRVSCWGRGKQVDGRQPEADEGESPSTTSGRHAGGTRYLRVPQSCSGVASTLSSAQGIARVACCVVFQAGPRKLVGGGGEKHPTNSRINKG